MEGAEVHIYTADVSPLENTDLFDEIYGSVSELRRKKTDRMRFSKDKNLSLGAEYLLMAACRDFGVDYNGAAVETDKNGKPYFSDSPLYFNLSHSDKEVMCIMSFFPVGCDVEKVHTIKNDISSRYFSDEEKRILAGCSSEAERQDIFFRLWTLKESFIKCTGQGIRIPLDSFSFYFPEDGSIKIRQKINKNFYSFYEYDVNSDYRYAACIENDNVSILLSGAEFSRVSII